MVSVVPGEWTSPYEGKGYEPLGYRDFEIGDDPRRINIPATARRGEPTIVERVALRDFKVMVVIDISPSMTLREKWAIQFKAVALLLYSAWKAETTFGFGVRTETGIRTFGLGIGSRHFYYLYRVLQGFIAGEEAQRPKGTRVPLSGCLPPNAMLFYCSDFLEADGRLADLSKLWQTVRRYDFIPVIIQDELEYAFPLVSARTFVPFSNPETGVREEVWISPRIARAIRSAHAARLEELTALLRGRSISPLHFDTPSMEAISGRTRQYFRNRQGPGHAA